jgi:hypothetical protein
MALPPTIGLDAMSQMSLMAETVIIEQFYLDIDETTENMCTGKVAKCFQLEHPACSCPGEIT